ncbi:MAG: hypothetical protein LBP58_06195, partial [Azoarcus sp.]|nr:hypothetical protein [Azoarcus sp.]
MHRILEFRGAPAFSPSRLARLGRDLALELPTLRHITAEYWYFIEVREALSAEEEARLGELLDARARGGEDLPAGTLRLVTPRPGTISPWSSKATDIARQCGFDKVLR